MPLTFPSHQGFVLPLKLWRPQWFDGVALGVGAAAPDVAYIFDGSGLPLWPLSHQPSGLVLWCLPVSLVLCWVFRRASTVVAAHLPAVLHDYGVLSRYRPPLRLTLASALIGAASHIVTDVLCDPLDAGEWVAHVGGALVTVAICVHIGRRHLLVAWHGPAPAPPIRPVLFWTVVGLVVLPGLAVLPFLPGAELVHTTGSRAIAVVVTGVLAGAGAVAVAGWGRDRRWIPRGAGHDGRGPGAG
jgi:hypothetical protein